MSLHTSREGALYQSYDNYAGMQGLYQPAFVEQRGPPRPPAGLTIQADNPYSHQGMAQSPQRIFQEFQQMRQENIPEIYMDPNMHGIDVPMMNPIAPVDFNKDLRGVGIKFGERMDHKTGGVMVFVKRVIPGGPAEQSRKVTPGDVLLLINSEDVYGLALEHLRNKIPGPAGTGVSLGFRNVYGQFYEVNLARTAYGEPEPVLLPPAFQPAPVMQQMVVPQPITQIVPQPEPRAVQYVVQGPPTPPPVQYVQLEAPPPQHMVQIVQPRPLVAPPPPMQYVTVQKPPLPIQMLPGPQPQFVDALRYQPQPQLQMQYQQQPIQFAPPQPEYQHVRQQYQYAPPQTPQQYELPQEQYLQPQQLYPPPPPQYNAQQQQQQPQQMETPQPPQQQYGVSTQV